MSQLHTELSNARALQKKLERDLASIRECADQKTTDQKLQQKMDYYRKEKDKKEKTVETSSTAIDIKLKQQLEKIDAQIAILNAKKEALEQKAEFDKKVLKDGIQYFELQIQECLEQEARERPKGAVEIRKEKELDDVKKNIVNLMAEIEALDWQQRTFALAVQEQQEMNAIRAEKYREKLKKDNEICIQIAERMRKAKQEEQKNIVVNTE